MSTDLHTHIGTPVEPHHESHEASHPTDAFYIKIAIFLAIVTAAEVATYYLDWFEDASTAVLLITLIPMMVIKFGVVCAYFMHLKYDNPIFRRVFVSGLLLAIAVYIVAMTTMELFKDA